MPNIVVLVKRVPDTNAKITVSGGSLDLSAVKFVISPFDEYAIEAALRHKEANGGTVTALTLGSDACDKVLKDAKALGVDNLVRLWNQGWENLDSNGVQSALASAIGDLGSDVVYCGKSAADSNAGSTGPGVG
ncbi:MAG: electron transfer flavoprotein beta subunit/FixA family protein, partial [Euryarchaeota archaeon]|nr:electron transfer flavoprotein beta subunit/FixA family protein [Euryarchaeota archaeon]